MGGIFCKGVDARVFGGSYICQGSGRQGRDMYMGVEEDDVDV
jgi:hypothetical protein